MKSFFELALYYRLENETINKIMANNQRMYRVYQKTHPQIAAGPTVHWLNHQ